MANLELRDVSKSYGSLEVMSGIDLDVEDGEFVVFVGPSGCGKSTLLRMIAGLEEINGGTVKIGGTKMNDVAPSKRGVAMVFQTYALYPHMDVYKNMAFGLKQAKTDPAEIKRRVTEAADVLQITDYLDRLPKNLSGGQRQRVAIGRAIVRDPEVFLFDEPLSNLDASLRVQTRLEIARLHNRLNATMIYVTHDQVEAMTLADKIVVLNAGSIAQVGPPMELYNRPKNIFVAGFIGSPKMNFFEARVSGGMAQISGVAVKAPDGAKKKIVMGIRPEHMRLASKDDYLVSGTLDLVEQLGEYALVHLSTVDGPITVKLDIPPSGASGSEMYFSADESDLHFFDKETGLRI